MPSDSTSADSIWLAALRASGRSPKTLESYAAAVAMLRAWRTSDPDLITLTRFEALAFRQAPGRAVPAGWCRPPSSLAASDVRIAAGGGVGHVQPAAQPDHDHGTERGQADRHRRTDRGDAPERQAQPPRSFGRGPCPGSTIRRPASARVPSRCAAGRAGRYRLPPFRLTRRGPPPSSSTDVRAATLRSHRTLAHPGTRVGA